MYDKIHTFSLRPCHDMVHMVEYGHGRDEQ